MPAKPTKSQAVPPLAERIKAELARRDLATWCQRVDAAYRVAKHHRKLIDALERVERGECKRLMVSMPPRHGKSLTTTTRFPSWFLGRNPDKTVIIASYAADLAYGFSRSCRNELEEFGPAVFNGVTIADDSGAVGKWSIAGHKGYLAAAGVGGPITGKGADVFIIDDPIKDASEANSEVIRNKVHSWWQAVARTRLAPGASVVLVMTRWHEDDLAGRLLNEAKDGGEQWEQIIMPMVDDADGSETDAAGRVKLLWPEQFGEDYGTAEKLARLKVAVGSRTWTSLYQQRPAPADGNKFKRDWWRFWRRDSDPLVQPHRPKDCYQGAAVLVPTAFDDGIDSFDLTFKDGKASDYIVGVKVGKKGPNRYVLEMLRKKGGFGAAKEMVVKLRGTEPDFGCTVIEAKANGEAVLEELRKALSGLLAENPKQGKEERAAVMEPQVEAGNWYLPDSAGWLDEFIEEFAVFPNGKHDDIVDACSQAAARFSADSELEQARILCGLVG